MDNKTILDVVKDSEIMCRRLELLEGLVQDLHINREEYSALLKRLDALEDSAKKHGHTHSVITGESIRV